MTSLNLVEDALSVTPVPFYRNGFYIHPRAAFREARVELVVFFSPVHIARILTQHHHCLNLHLLPRHPRLHQHLSNQLELGDAYIVNSR